jgi:hypothetical protein
MLRRDNADSGSKATKICETGSPAAAQERRLVGIQCLQKVRNTEAFLSMT